MFHCVLFFVDAFFLWDGNNTIEFVGFITPNKNL